MLRLVLLALLLIPGAGAWAVDARAPEAWGSGLPLVVEACVDGPPGASVELKAQLTSEGSTVGGSARYGDAFPLDGAGRACRTLSVATRDIEANATLLVRLRPAGGDAAADARLPLRLLRAPVAVDAEGRLVPVFEGPAPRLHIVAVHGAPYAGVTVENAGDAEARLLGHEVGGASLPDVRVPPGGTVFLGARPPPDAPASALAQVTPRVGRITLTAAERALDVFDAPKLARGEEATLEGVRVMGRTHLAPRTLRVEGTLVAYATPDAGAAPIVDLLDGATREVLVTSYTLSADEVGAALLRAARRGVDVRIILEGAPVGGVSDAEESLVAALAANGARVDFLRSTSEFPTRFLTVHAKTLVVDRERVLVATENLHDSSYPAVAGAAGTRGYGILVEHAELAGVFAQVFLLDDGLWPDVQRADASALAPARAPLPRAGAVAGPLLRVEGAFDVEPVFSPDTSYRLVDAIANATSSVDVAMLFAEPSFRTGPNPFTEALLAAARRGATVRLLLDGEVDEGRNRVTADALNAIAAREGLPLVARVDDAPRVLHAKMVLIDGRVVYVGSMNWGRASMMENREAGLLVDAPQVAAFFQPTFDADFQEEPARVAAGERAPVPGIGALAVVVVLSALPLRARVRRWRA